MSGTRRFTVRYFKNRGKAAAMEPGYAVYHYEDRITITWPTWEEAERHRKKIAEYYLRWGW